ncbi:MAG: bifunctional (p)ppGpp synthetase/guanosine-3',5'-bis(diphosphate) 3'-pyrophosphohydrolase [Myxococcales bacterium]|nr:bifunctional (p)ppGpp synthetase/guanosine-3',5'-bis(diphosphate) 3'-pyrophosphohydrolase [Myxococcales bacterium]
MWSADLFARALDFAAKAHGEQKVPGSGFPYVTHVTKVALEALRACVEEPSLDANLALACAVLHDSLEDAGVTRAQVELEFGAAVAAGVQALTKDATLPKDKQLADSLARIRREPREVWLVKLADRITNLEAPPHYWSLEKRRKYRAEALEIHAALGAAHAALAARLEARAEAYLAYCREPGDG